MTTWCRCVAEPLSGPNAYNLFGNTLTKQLNQKTICVALSTLKILRKFSYWESMRPDDRHIELQIHSCDLATVND